MFFCKSCTAVMPVDKAKAHIYEEWDKTIVPALCEYVKIPSQSPSFDPEWATNGLQEKAMDVLVKWLKSQPVKGMRYELLSEPNRTPFLFIEIDGTTETKKTVLMYGHMDKQPPLLPWEEGLGPYDPVIREGKLYGRGGADDGYSLFAAVTSIVALQKAEIPHSRTVIIIEAAEESGSTDLDYYIEKMKTRMGEVNMIVCLDSGAQTYDKLWLTSSLRGVCIGVLSVRILKEGMHSGVAGGVVPDSFRIARSLLDRIENPITGEILVKEAFVNVPESVRKGMEPINELGSSFKDKFCTLPGMKLEPGNNLELAIRNFWSPSLTVTGANLPEVVKAGNVIRNETQLKLSFRCPPKVDTKFITKRLKEILTADPPYCATVTFDALEPGNGWAAPELKPWLEKAVNEGSLKAFNNPFAYTGEGGSIPLMNMLSDMYPEAQFIVTGVLGPKSNAHGPNEFLHIPFAKGVTLCVAHAVAAHYKHAKQ